MPNAIKYNTSAETLALKKGNFWIGTGDVGKGPTSSTGYYNGITPPSGGYTIYLNKASGGPSIYTVNTEAQLTGLTSTIAGESYSTSGACLNWFATQTDKMIFNRDCESIITNGLVLSIDAGFTPSYPTTGITWYDLSANGYNETLTNGPTYNSNNGGSIGFDGVDDYAVLTNSNLKNYTTITANMWMYVTSSNTWETYFSYNAEEAGLTQGWGVRRVSSNNMFQYWGGLGNSGIKLYQNGKLLDLSNSAYSSVNATINNTWQMITLVANNVSSWNTHNRLTIGTRSDSVNSATNMKVSSFNLYNRALSNSEINQNYYAMLNSRMIVTNSLVINLQAGNLNSYSGGGTVWKDVSGYGNDFTLVNNLTFNTGNGGYLQFDGTDDYAYLAVNSSISVGTACSLEMVIKNDFSMRMGAGGGYWSYGFEGAGFAHTCGGNGNISPYFIAAEFHHYVFTWNQAQNNHSMYRDGTLVYSFTPTCGFNAGGGGYFVLGGAYSPNTVPAPGFQSYGSPHIAQLRLYGKVLTNSEVEQNFNLMKLQYGL
jgi:hypothetical protein